ncbi:MAG: knotted carbamoyltransferase YgeW [Bacteroidales bacterium]
MDQKFNSIIAEIAQIKTNLSNKDFLLTWEKSLGEIKQILLVAEALKYLRDTNHSVKCFDSGLAVSIFRDQSTRTRFSFASAANLLGLEVQDFDESKSQISHGETVRETANMISFCSDVIGIRDDKYPGIGHNFMKEVGEALDDGYQNGVLPQRPGIVNLQCDIDHPTQSLSDLLHLKQEFGSLENLKGKKIAMTWAYSPSYGKPLSVPQGIVGLMTRFGMDVHLAHPQGYDLQPEVINTAKKQSIESGGKITVSNSMSEAFKDADIVYPKSWAPYSIMQRRSELYLSNDKNGLEKLEKEGLQQNAKYMSWECTEEMMSLTKDEPALYMHCLPADITGVSCAQGEVSQKVFEKYRHKTYIEAGYKPYIIAAMIVANKYKNTADLLEQLMKAPKNQRY